MHSIAIPDVRIHTDEAQRAELFGKADEVITSLTQFQIDNYDWQLTSLQHLRGGEGLMATVTRASAKLQSEELKDAYRGWLKDLYDDKPEKLLRKLGKKKKNGGGRRARQIQRLQHAQQHTAASALKDVALKKAERAKLPALSLLRYTPVDKQALHESQNRRHQALVDEANYSSFQYAHHPSWRPGLAFFQQLVRFVLQKVSPGIDNDSDVSGGVVSAELAGFPLPVAPVLLRIPVRRHRLAVALLFCQEHNQEQEQEHDVSDGTASFVLHCRLYSRASDWREHRNALLDIVSNSSTEVCAVRKCAEDFESRSNEIKSLRSRQEVGEAMDELWVDYSDTDTSPNIDTDLFAIQRYIPFKGVSSNAFATGLAAPAERKAWVARCASRKRDKKSSTIWIITGGDSTDSTTTNSTSTDCQLVKCNIDQAWPEPRLLTSMCAISLEKALRIRFNELVLDLLQDMMGNWWLLQVKAFTLGAVRPTSANASSASSLSKKSSRGLSRTLSAPNQFGAGMIPTPKTAN
ncbi:hypothetical protein ON010_g18069 [Phytophthora cinnamomi]|nr:hypothetical protein ON010_g18069 [Phytophthora cinnamomi]